MIKCAHCKRDYDSNTFIGARGRIVTKCQNCRARNSLTYDADKRRQYFTTWYSNAYPKNKEKFRASKLKYMSNMSDEAMEIHRRKELSHRMEYRGRIHVLLRMYKHGATRRHLVFDLTDEEAGSMFQSACFYCGTKGDPLNGIDRMNNSSGYCIENCVGCCGVCNKTKQCLDTVTFIERSSYIASVSNVSEPDLDSSIWHDTKPRYVTMSQYQKRSRETGKVFQLSREEFDNLTMKPCHFCARPSSATHKNGIDRLDNNFGYVIENCRSCCGQCNIAKGTRNDVQYLELCKSIASNWSQEKIDELKLKCIPRSVQIFTKRRRTEISS